MGTIPLDPLSVLTVPAYLHDRNEGVSAMECLGQTLRRRGEVMPSSWALEPRGPGCRDSGTEVTCWNWLQMLQIHTQKRRVRLEYGREWLDKACPVPVNHGRDATLGNANLGDHQRQ